MKRISAWKNLGRNGIRERREREGGGHKEDVDRLVDVIR